MRAFASPCHSVPCAPVSITAPFVMSSTRAAMYGAGTVRSRNTAYAARPSAASAAVRLITTSRAAARRARARGGSASMRALSTRMP
jgi:hypothetical protein